MNAGRLGSVRGKMRGRDSPYKEVTPLDPREALEGGPESLAANALFATGDEADVEVVEEANDA